MTHVNRHRPRLCRECTAPMAGQSSTCWSCGAAWKDEPSADVPPGKDAADKTPQLAAVE